MGCTNAQLAEEIRQALPDIASPIHPGEKIAQWIERAARACGVPAARLRAYWHHRVEVPLAIEYVRVASAAQQAMLRRLAIEALERDIAAKAASLATERSDLVAGHPILARFLPAVPDAAQAIQDRVARRASGGRRA